jgi:hypothetical protein
LNPSSHSVIETACSFNWTHPIILAHFFSLLLKSSSQTKKQDHLFCADLNFIVKSTVISIPAIYSPRFLSPIFCLWLLFCNTSILAAHDTPFAPGEKLTYQISWSFIPAGRATLEIAPTANAPVEGAAYHFIS